MEAVVGGRCRVCRGLRSIMKMKVRKTRSARCLASASAPRASPLASTGQSATAAPPTSTYEISNLAIRPVPSLSFSSLDETSDLFRQRAFVRQQPMVLKPAPGAVSENSFNPTLSKWFEPVEDDVSIPKRIDVTEYVRSFQAYIVPYELRYPQWRLVHGDAVQNFIRWLRSGEAGRPEDTAQYGVLASILDRHVNPRIRNDEQVFIRFDAPLALLFAALDFNKAQVKQNKITATLRNMYIAQCALNDLPDQLAADLPTPELVQRTGRGDVYGTSLWMGLERTFTPLHRDPNPNLFVQLCGYKEVRLLPPLAGDELYRQVQVALDRGQLTGPAVRGDEMMQGSELEVWRKTIWPSEGQRHLVPKLPWSGQKRTVLEAKLGRGDALFIPKGWWHSVQSTLGDGRLNASANWWFR